MHGVFSSMCDVERLSHFLAVSSQGALLESARVFVRPGFGRPLGERTSSCMQSMAQPGGRTGLDRSSAPVGPTTELTTPLRCRLGPPSTSSEPPAAEKAPRSAVAGSVSVDTAGVRPSPRLEQPTHVLRARIWPSVSFICMMRRDGPSYGSRSASWPLWATIGPECGFNGIAHRGGSGWARRGGQPGDSARNGSWVRCFVA